MRHLRAGIGRRTGPVDAAEPEPRAAAEAEHASMVASLAEVRRGTVEVVMSRKRLEAQANQLRTELQELRNEAGAAVASEQDDRARAALGRALETERRLAGREKTIATLRGQERDLEAASARLASGIEDRRVRLEVTAARAAAAAAAARAEASSEASVEAEQKSPIEPEG
jgi:phage shock protein A